MAFDDREFVGSNAPISGAGASNENDWPLVVVRERFQKRLGAMDIDIEKVEASYRDGILTLSVPKAVSVQPRRIQVKS